MVLPPSMLNVFPVTNRIVVANASIVHATSSASPTLLSGVFLIVLSKNACGLPSKNFVLTALGAIDTTLTFGASTLDKFRVNESSAAFDAAYARLLPPVFTPAADDIVTINPCFDACSIGANALITAYVPLTLTFIISSNVSSSIASKFSSGIRLVMPAVLTRMSQRPATCLTFVTASAIAELLSIG